jgi:glycosyltransferase involved in cell wall biosynthesis
VLGRHQYAGPEFRVQPPGLPEKFRMKIAVLTTDNRECFKHYERAKPYFGTAPAALLQGFAALPEVEVHVISCSQVPLTPLEKIGENIWFHSLHVPRWGWLRTGYLGCIRAVRKKLRELQPDIVHGHGTERDCAISAAFSGWPNVITIHGNMRALARVNQARLFSYLGLAAQLERYVLPRTSGVVCITRYTEGRVKNLARQTWVVPNAVDQQFLEIQAQAETAALPIGLCIGTICLHKNQNAFIQALDPLAAQRPFRMFFAGEAVGAYGEEFHQLIQTRPWCEFAGFIGREQLRRQLKTATFLALPSWEDNCPMVVLEAMAAGVPVVASNIGGVPDLIESERTGLLCDPNRPESFREQVARLLAEPHLAQQLAANARSEVLRRFHPQVIARRHLEIYREVVQSRR